MPLGRHFFCHIVQTLKGDAESEIDGMHLRVFSLKEWQQGIVGKETDIFAANAERSIQFELVDACSIIAFDLRAVGELHPIPLCDT